jgi:hypothetical protein
LHLELQGADHRDKFGDGHLFHCSMISPVKRNHSTTRRNNHGNNCHEHEWRISSPKS